MSTLYDVLSWSHIGIALAILGGYVLSVQADRVHPVMVWAARLQLLVGLALVGIAESQDWSVNHAKIGVKLVVSLAVVACLEIAASRSRKGATGTMNLVHAALALGLVNAAVAMIW